MATGPYSPRVVDTELDELIDSAAALAIDGAKGISKTATASRRAATVRELDRPAQRSIAAGDPERLLEGPRPVLIDEWQYLPESWDLVRRAVDGGAAPGSFLLTGSAQPTERGSHSGAARILSIRMRPLALSERGPEPPTVGLAQLLGGGRPKLKGASSMRLKDSPTRSSPPGFPGCAGSRRGRCADISTAICATSSTATSRSSATASATLLDCAAG